MAVPNLQYIVQQVRDSQAWDFTTKEGLCEYTNTVVCELYAADPNFGHLKKSEGQNHCVDPNGNRCATDVTLYKPTGQVVDFIVSAGYGNPPPSNDVTWHPGPEHEYSADYWFAPVESAGVPETPADDDVLGQILHLCEQIKLLCDNINAQINLMAGEVNNIRAAQGKPYSGQQVGPGKTLTLTVKP